MAARTDVESANTELARIEAEFAKFVAAHDETSTVLKMLQHGPNKQPMHGHGGAQARGEAHARSGAHKGTAPFWSCKIAIGKCTAKSAK